MRAIAIRQPWAWGVIYARKDCENRTERTSRAFQAAVGKRIYVHARKAFPTKAELAYAIKSLRRRGIECPDPNELAYGGVIGSVFVAGIVTAHRSRWFQGPAALVLKDPRPARFRPAKGQLGLFRIR
jgi:hypothetical protein